MLLQRVSHITGLSVNRLIYEILLNPHFHIPLPKIDEETAYRSNYNTIRNPAPAPAPAPAAAAAASSNGLVVIQGRGIQTGRDIGELLQSDPKEGAKALKRHLLLVMGDRIVASLTLSSVVRPEEVRGTHRMCTKIHIL
jgi:hypothetical protein